MNDLAFGPCMYGQFSHLKLEQCSRCKAVCYKVETTGVDCYDVSRIPEHACFPCRFGAGENFRCKLYLKYGVDCSGGFPEHVPALPRVLYTII